MSWVNDLYLMDVIWSGNAQLQYAETKGRIGYYDANSNTVIVINLQNTSNILLPYNDIENNTNVYTDQSNIVFQFTDYDWVIHYEPRVYGNGNVTVICDNCCSGCGANEGECICIEIPESKGCGLQPGDIIYQDVPLETANVVLTVEEFTTVYSTIKEKCPGCLGNDKEYQQGLINESARTIQVITQLPQRITAEVVAEDVGGLNVVVRHATGRFVQGYPFGRVGEPPCTLVNIVYLDFDFFFGGYIIEESGQFRQDCYFPCGPRDIPDANSCINLGPLENLPIWSVYRERDIIEIENLGFYDGYYILPNLTAKTRAYNNDEPFTPIGHITEEWTDPNRAYTVIGMNVDRLRYNAWVYGV